MMKQALFLCIFVSGCSAPADTVEFTGCGTDEHQRTFDDQEPMAMVSSGDTPTMTKPDLTQTLAFASKPVFQWTIDAVDPGKPDGDVPYMDGTPGCNMCCPQFNTGALTTLHEPAVSGDVYDLRFSTGGNEVHRLITTLQEWTPDDTLWKSWKGATVTLKLYRMTLLMNEDKAGPYTSSQPLTVKVGS
jgi:hypothetical protein